MNSASMKPPSAANRSGDSFARVNAPPSSLRDALARLVLAIEQQNQVLMILLADHQFDRDEDD